MNKTLALGHTLLRAGIINATIQDKDTVYEFVHVGHMEFQFGPVGNILTTYTIGTLELKPHDYGDLMTIEEFKRDCDNLSLTNYDGTGRYATDKEVSNIKLKPSDYWYGILDTRWTHIMWYNR